MGIGIGIGKATNTCIGIGIGIGILIKYCIGIGNTIFVYRLKLCILHIQYGSVHPPGMSETPRRLPDCLGSHCHRLRVQGQCRSGCEPGSRRRT